MNWLRLHTDIKENRQLQQMPAEMFRQLISIWCIAKEHDQGGVLPPIPDIAFQLRISDDECKSLITKLVAMSLLLKCDAGVTVKNWGFWQYRDDSKNRVASLRKRQRNVSVTGGVTVGVTAGGRNSDGSGNDEVTNANVTVTLTEQSRTEQSRTERACVRDAQPENQNSIPDLTDAFEAIWRDYPAKGRTKKIACQQYFVDVVGNLRGESLAAMLERIHEPLRPGGAWAESDKWANGFVQGFDTYLSQRQWDEEPVPAEDGERLTPAQRRARAIEDSWK